MTHKYLYLFIAFCLLAACSEERERFSVELPEGAFRFTPAMGGAILHYTLPADPEVTAINVRYKDAYGREILKTGSNATDRLALTGFNEAVTDVPAQISFLKRNNEESQPIAAQFSTADSAPIRFIESVEVKSGWNGCTLEYDNPQGTTGMAHVFYLGSSPIDQRPDTIWIESFPLTEGHDVKHYTPKQKQPHHTIIVRAEDYRGYIVREKVWEKIHAFNVERLEPEQFSLIYHNSLEIPEERIGLQYLTDGDTKGTAWFQTQDLHHYYTFLSRTNGAGADAAPMYIDLKKKRPVSEVRLYAYRHIGKAGWNARPSPDWGRAPIGTTYQGPQYFKNYVMNKLPCSVTLYGCRQEVADPEAPGTEWEELYAFDDDPDLPDADRWTYRAVTCGGTTNLHRFATLAALEKASPICKIMSVDIEKQGEGFRHLKLQFNKVYNLYPTSYERESTTNKHTKHLSFHELEIYSDKE